MCIATGKTKVNSSQHWRDQLSRTINVVCCVGRVEIQIEI